MGQSGTATLGVALVGTGLAARMHATALRLVPEVRLLGNLGTTPEKSRGFAAENGVPRAYRDLEELLLDPEVQIVHLCTPPHTHPELTDRLAAAGKNVLVDKPLARTVGEARGMQAFCRNRGVMLGGLFQHRFIPLCASVKQAVEQGRLGRLHLVDCYVKWWRQEAYYRGSSWRARPETEGGGALINQAIHSIDLLQWIAGPVVEVTGRTATAVHAIGTEDVGVAILRTAEGALGVIEGSTATYPGFPERLELHGSRGTVILDEGRRQVQWYLEGESPRVDEAGTRQGNASDPGAVSPEAHAAAFTDFVRAVRDGHQPAVDGAEATKALEIVEAIYRSSAAGGLPLSLPLGV